MERIGSNCTFWCYSNFFMANYLLNFLRQILKCFFGYGAHWINFYQYFENPYYYYRYFSYIVYFPTLLIIFFVLSLVTLKFNEKNKFLFCWVITYFYILFLYLKPQQIMDTLNIFNSSYVHNDIPLSQRKI